MVLATLASAVFYVSPRGDDAASGASPQTPWRHVQRAFDVAPAGSTVHVEAGRYREHLVLHVSGSATAGYTTFQADGRVILDGAAKTDGTPIVSISTASYVKLIGFDVVNFVTKQGGGAVLFEGSGDHVQLLNNIVHHTRGFEATAIGIYGTDASTPISNLTIDGNTVYDCQPADSETVTLNGNVTGFIVTNNVVHETNNIGIDFIGGEGTSSTLDSDTARDGLCAENHVYGAHSNYGDGYGAGIYVDGGANITIERNTVNSSDMGIEVGCEHAGRTTTGVIVRNNLLYDNDRAGLAMGGYAAKVGRVADCTFVNNTILHNQTKPDENGDIWIQLASQCTIENNLVVAGKQGVVLSTASDGGVRGVGNELDHNLYFSNARAGRILFGWGGTVYRSLAVFTTGSGEDVHSIEADPKLVKPAVANVHLAAGSKAIGAGDADVATGSIDLYGNVRVVNDRIDIGAAETP